MASNQNGTNGTSTRAGQPPIGKIKVGSVTASIWETEGQYGPMHSVTFDRTYVDSDGNFQNTSTFNRGDLLELSEASRSAFLWCDRRSQEWRRNNRAAQPATQPQPQPQGNGTQVNPALMQQFFGMLQSMMGNGTAADARNNRATNVPKTTPTGISGDNSDLLAQ